MTKIIAHRGASYAAPENTLASVKLAWELNADGVEVDVRLSGDGRVILMHDANTLRTTGQAHDIHELSLPELQELDATFHRRPRWTGPAEPPPALPEVLSIIPPGKEILIELKDGPELLEPLGMDLEESGLAESQIKLITFNFDLATEAKRRFPELDVFLVYGDYENVPDSTWAEYRDQLITQVRAEKLDGLDLRADPAHIDAAYIAQIHKAGLQAYVWTSNDPLSGRHFLDAGLDGITTDLPDWMRVLRGK